MESDENEEAQWRLENIGLIADVGFEACVFAPIVEPEDGVAEFVGLPVPGRIAI